MACTSPQKSRRASELDEKLAKRLLRCEGKLPSPRNEASPIKQALPNNLPAKDWASLKSQGAPLAGSSNYARVWSVETAKNVALQRGSITSPKGIQADDRLTGESPKSPCQDLIDAPPTPPCDDGKMHEDSAQTCEGENIHNVAELSDSDVGFLPALDSPEERAFSCMSEQSASRSGGPTGRYDALETADAADLHIGVKRRPWFGWLWRSIFIMLLSLILRLALQNSARYTTDSGGELLEEIGANAVLPQSSSKSEMSGDPAYLSDAANITIHAIEVPPAEIDSEQITGTTRSTAATETHDAADLAVEEAIAFHDAVETHGLDDDTHEDKLESNSPLKGQTSSMEARQITDVDGEDALDDIHVAAVLSAALVGRPTIQSPHGAVVSDPTMSGDVSELYYDILSAYLPVSQVYRLGRPTFAPHLLVKGTIPRLTIDVCIANNGAISWPADTVLELVHGHALGLEILPLEAELPAHVYVNLTLQFTFPVNCESLHLPSSSSASVWMLKGGGQRFGPLLMLEVQCESETI